MSGCASIKFMGKVYGTQKDYWVASGILTTPEEATDPAEIEPRGAGVNANVYWVTDNILNDWIQLPECKPEYI